jgi:hypothetical protein
MATVAVLSIVALAFVASSFPMSASAGWGHGGWRHHRCNVFTDIFCDNFNGRTWFKDQTSWAEWYRYPDDDVSDYIHRGRKLRLQINTNSREGIYSNANISTSRINEVNTDLRFGVNTRAEARIRFSENMNADALNPGTARGSAGFLFWNYFQGEPGYLVTPEDGHVERPPQDIVGFAWQDANSTIPGLSTFAAIGGVPALFEPVDVDMSEYHIYAIERRPNSFKLFVDDTLIGEIPVNVEGGYHFIPDDHKLSTDSWVDNASYQYDLQTFNANLTFNEVDENQWVDVDYIRVVEIE